jgi:hypothetical protein
VTPREKREAKTEYMRRWRAANPDKMAVQSERQAVRDRARERARVEAVAAARAKWLAIAERNGRGRP